MTSTFVILLLVVALTSYMWYRDQNKKREDLMSKKDEKELKEFAEIFEQQLSEELERISTSDNPLQALLDMAKEDELDPIKDFDKILVRPKGEYEQ
jgi:competence protein ComGF